MLLAAGASAPEPPADFVTGVNGLPRALSSATADARAVGFEAVRIFLRWDRIEPARGAPDWTCRYVTDTDLGPDADGDGIPDLWPGTPCDAGPCGCGYSADTNTVSAALAKIGEMNAWCAASPRCPGLYVTEFGARDAGPIDCGGPKTARPGAADVAAMKRCRKRRWCRGIFLYALSDQNKRPDCARGLLDRRGCRKRRLCTIAKRFFGVTPPFSCVGCGP